MRHCYPHNAAGGSHMKHCNNAGDVSGENFKIPVQGYINSQDFCSAVNRCLAAEEENNQYNCHCRCRRY